MADRRERFGDLQQLLDATLVVEPRLAQDARGVAQLAELYLRAVQWEAAFSWPAAASRIDQLAADLAQLSAHLSGRLEAQEQALARLPPVDELAAHVAELEHALVALRTQQQAAQARLLEALQKAQAQRTAAEERAQDEAETREAFLALHPPKPAWLLALGPALLGGLVAGAAVVAFFTFFVFGPARSQPAAGAAQTVATPAESEAARKVSVTESATVAVPPSAPPMVPPAAPFPQVAVAGTGGAFPSAAPPLATAQGAGSAAGPVPAAASGSAAAGPPASGPPPGTPQRSSGSAGPVSAARMARAVARSQVVRGDNALEKGRADEAIEQFRTAIENDPDFADAHRGLGMAYALRNLDVQARSEYERYLALAPAAEDADDIRRAIAELSSRSKLGDSPK